MEETEKQKYTSFLPFKSDVIPRSMPNWDNKPKAPAFDLNNSFESSPMAGMFGNSVSVPSIGSVTLPSDQVYPHLY